jgi:hypothetical protein
MKRKFYSLFLMLLMLGGTFAVTSCQDNEEEEAQATTGPQTPEEVRESVQNALTELRLKLQEMNFNGDLAPVNQTITRAGVVDDSTNPNAGEVNGNSNSTINRLLRLLLTKLAGFDIEVDPNGGVQDLPYHRQLNIQSLNDVMSIAWQITGRLTTDPKAVTSYFANQSTQNFDIVYLNDNGVKYIIRAVIDKGTFGMDGKQTSQTERQLRIMQEVVNVDENGNETIGEEEVVSFRLLGQNLVNYNPLNMNAVYDGKIYYQNFVIGLEYSKLASHAHQLSMRVDLRTNKPLAAWWEVDYQMNLINANIKFYDNLTVVTALTGTAQFKGVYEIKILDGLLFAKGTILDCKSFINDALEMYEYDEDGATQTTINTKAKSMNKNADMTMYFGGTNIGTVTWGYEFSADIQNYKPTMYLTSPIFGKNPLSWTETKNAFSGITSVLFDFIDGAGEIPEDPWGM